MQYVLITAKLVALKRENTEPILTLKGTEWRKFIDDFGLSIEADPSRVVNQMTGDRRVYGTR